MNYSYIKSFVIFHTASSRSIFFLIRPIADLSNHENMKNTHLYACFQSKRDFLIMNLSENTRKLREHVVNKKLNYTHPKTKRPEKLHVVPASFHTRTNP